MAEEKKEPEEKAREIGITSPRRPIFSLNATQNSEQSPGKSAPIKTPSSMGVYLMLLLLSLFMVWAKNFIAYNPFISLAFSIFTAFVFYIVVHSSPEAKLKELLIIIALGLDVAVSQSVLYFLPESITGIVIAINVFAWVIVAIIFFLWGFVEAVGAHQRLGWISRLVALGLVGFIIFLAFPFIFQNAFLYQDQTHTEYFYIAKQQLTKAGTSLAEAKNTWSDSFGCAFSPLFSGEVTNQVDCMKQKRAERSCRATFQDEKQIQECIQQQLDERRQVGGAIDQQREPIKLSFKTDPFLARKVNLGDKFEFSSIFEYQNPSDQVITVDFSCQFTRYGAAVPGRISSSAQLKIPGRVGLSAPFPTTGVKCVPEGELKVGSYQVEFMALAKDMHSFSRITRFFVGDSSKLPTAIQLIQQTEKVSSIMGSFGEAKGVDPAWLAFGIGNTASNPIVTNNGNLQVGIKIRNDGTGALKAIKSYRIQAEGFNAPCLEGVNIPLAEAKASQKEIPLAGCEVTDYPEKLKNPFTPYESIEFRTEMIYDYNITYKESTTVNT